MFSINVSGLDDSIDERFEYNMDIGSHYSGCGLIDDKTGRLVSPMNYHTDKGTYLGIIQRQQQQIDEIRIHHELLWKRFEISEEVNSNKIEMLLERVKVLEKEVEKL
jgi:hypothetical protein